MVISDTATLLGEPLLAIWNELVYIVPGLLAAILILILGYLIGALIGQIITKILIKTKLVSTTIKKMGLSIEIGKWDISSFIGLIVKWYIFVIFLNPAAQVVMVSSISSFFRAVGFWIPNIILAIIIILAGYVLSEYIAIKIRQVKSTKRSLAASIAKIITLVFVLLMALRQIGVDVSVAESAVLIILSGIMLAVAIAFGLGLKDDAKKLIKDIKKKI